MAIQKQPANINFAHGLDQKTDKFQVQAGKMLGLQNTVFSKVGLLQKRNGFGPLAPLPTTTYNALTTFNGNLTAIGTKLSALSQGSNTWIDRGQLQPVNLSVLTTVRSSTNQTQCDSVISANNLVCTVYTDNNAGVVSYKYTIADATTGQTIVNPTLLAATSGSVNASPRAFLLGSYFIIMFPTTTGHIQYIAVNSNTPTVALTAVDLTSVYKPSSTSALAYDAVVANNNLYLVYNATDGGGAIRITFIDSTLLQHNSTVFATASCDNMSVTADVSGVSPVIYAAYYDIPSTKAYVLAVNQTLVTILAPTQVVGTGPIVNITSVATAGLCTVLYEITNAYSYDSTTASNYIKSVTCTSGGVVGSPAVVIRSVGLASKAALINGLPYFLTVYQSKFQPTYFLSNGSGQLVAKLAYANGGGYVTAGLPGVSVSGSTISIAYLLKDLITSANKSQGASVAGIYSQTGCNLANFKLSGNQVVTSEIGGNLHISGGFLWAYDGQTPVEQGFHLYPDSVQTTVAGTGGGMAISQYYYQAVYEWTDQRGNIHRSAPSIPVSANIVTTTPVTFQSVFANGATSLTASSVVGLRVGQILTDSTTGGNIQAGTYITAINGSVVSLSLPTAGASAVGPGDTISTANTGMVTVNVPTLRLTYKTANPVRINLYRWSTGQQNYFQVTPIASPLINDPTVDSVSFVDVLPDNQIIGNALIYTTGGVLENVAPPATNVTVLFNNRLMLISAEDNNSLFFSKQVINATPVEMSDLLTIYVAPTTGVQGSTGPTLAASTMDDKLILFKSEAIYYITGQGPDNTGSNNQYSDPQFISSTVGCSNQQSIVFTPTGLMFESDKGIWKLGRDLSTVYIGARVEDFTKGNKVLSAIAVPGTNQVRFSLSSGVTLMYDYFFDEWGTFTNVPAVASTQFNALHTYIDARGRVMQETPGAYLDGSSPVLMSFTTSWFNLAGLQGYQRAYRMYLLASYLSPHRLSIQVAYDYNPSPTQQRIIQPDNYSANYGADSLWGGGATWGGASNVEQWRLDFQQQKCQAFQLTVQELFDPSFGTQPGGGFTMSGIDLQIGVKGGTPKVRAGRTVG